MPLKLDELKKDILIFSIIIAIIDIIMLVSTQLTTLSYVLILTPQIFLISRGTYLFYRCPLNTTTKLFGGIMLVYSIPPLSIFGWIIFPLSLFIDCE